MFTDLPMSRVRPSTTMPTVGLLAFEIRDAFEPPDGYEGDVTLAGVWVDNDGDDLALGDGLMVPTLGGRTVRATVAQFPQMSFTDRALRAVSVFGVRAADVQVGGLAERASH